MNYRKNKDKFMKKYVVIALVAILGTVNAVAQTALSFSGDRATVKTEGKHYIPQSVWNSNQTLYLDIVNAIEPEIGFEEWTGQNSWISEPGSQWGGNSYARLQQYIKIDVPGLWTNAYSGVGEEKKIYVRRIADPTLTVGATSKPLSEWSSPIDVPAGTNVELSFISFFVSPGNNWIEENTVEITPSQQSSYSLSGNGNVEYTMNSRDGKASNATYSKSFTLNYPSAIPVTGVSLNKTSITLTEGGEETLIATVNPDNASNKNVSWSSSNTYAATVDATGKVSAVFFGTGTAIITATTEDGNYTDECLVEVTAGTAAFEVVLESTIAIYPNPAKEYLYVTGVEEGLVLLTLVDISGKSLLVQTVANNQYVNISSLPSGAYIVKLQAKDKTIAKKILK